MVRVLRGSVVALGFACAVLLIAADRPAAQGADPHAVLNKQTLIYHRASCTAARRCTRNCIVVKL